MTCHDGHRTKDCICTRAADRIPQTREPMDALCLARLEHTWSTLESDPREVNDASRRVTTCHFATLTPHELRTNVMASSPCLATQHCWEWHILGTKPQTTTMVDTTNIKHQKCPNPRIWGLCARRRLGACPRDCRLHPIQDAVCCRSKTPSKARLHTDPESKMVSSDRSLLWLQMFQLRMGMWQKPGSKTTKVGDAADGRTRIALGSTCGTKRRHTHPLRRCLSVCAVVVAAFSPTPAMM